MGFKEVRVYVFSLFINMLLVLGVMNTAFKIESVDRIFIIELFLLGVFIFWLFNSVIKKRIKRVQLALGVVLLIIALLAFGYGFNLVEIVDYINQNTNDIIRAVYKGKGIYFYEFQPLILIFLPIITALLMWGTLRINKNSILILTFIVMVVFWFSGYKNTVQAYLFRYIFISIITFIINNHFEKIENLRKNSIEIHIKKFQFISLSIVIAMFCSILVVLLPSNLEAKDLSSIINDRFLHSKKTSNGKGSGEYNLSLVGYTGNEKRLGGPISIKYQELFKVQSDKPYYLRGTIKGNYDGESWGKIGTFKKLRKYSFLDIYNFYSFLMKDKSMKIYPEDNFRTTTLFTPNLTYNIDIGDREISYNKASAIITDEYLREPYTVFFNAIYDTKKFEFSNIASSNMAEFNKYMNYNLSPEVVKKFNENQYKINKGQYISDTDKIHSDSFNNEFVLDIYKDYLQVPENISPKIYALVDKIIEGSNSSIEKVEAIRNYLKKNYEYSLDVSPLPEGEEFINYFLYTEKKGYCTYFATAMTIMCRIAGVPARYVEGFKMSDSTDGRGLYVVSNADAHAWSEVLVLSDENIWAIADAAPTIAENLKEKQKEEEMAQMDEEMPIPIMNKEDRGMLPEDLESNVAENNIFYMSLWLKILISIIIVISTYFGIGLFTVLRKKNKIISSKSIIPLYCYYLEKLEKINIDKSEFTPDMEFAEGIRDRALRENMIKIVCATYEEYYGNKDNDDLEKRLLYDFIEEYVKEKQGDAKYYIYKYIIWMK